MQKGKMAVRVGLKIAMKRRGVKGKGEKERYTHLNEEFQKIARRDTKAFLGDECKEIEENSRMGKTSKESACNVRDQGSIPGLGRSPGEGNGNPLQ